MAQLEYRGLWGYVISDKIIKPEEKEKITSAKEALFILKSSISPKELMKTGNCTTAAQLWKVLQENYEGSKASIATTVGVEFMSFDVKQGEDLIALLGRYESLLAKTEAVNYNVNSDLKIAVLSSRLPDKYYEVSKFWQQCNPSGTVSQLISHLKVRYHEETYRKKQTDSVIFTSNSNKKNVEKKGIQKSENTNQKSTPQRKNEFKSTDYLKFTCAHCKAIGHHWKKCIKLSKEMQEVTKKILGNNAPQKASHPTPSGSKGPKGDETIYLTMDTSLIAINSESDWVADSGATAHVTPHKHKLSNWVQ